MSVLHVTNSMSDKRMPIYELSVWLSNHIFQTFLDVQLAVILGAGVPPALISQTVELER